MLDLSRELGVRFEHFQSLDSFAKSSFVLGSEAWEQFYYSGLFKDLVYGRKGRLGCMARSPVSFSESLWGSEGCRRRGW